MTVVLATPAGVIRDRDLALGRAVTLEGRADRLDREGRPVEASALRSRARTIRALWE
jgi:hypothetical protein